jgi:hypothetical protein
LSIFDLEMQTEKSRTTAGRADAVIPFKAVALSLQSNRWTLKLPATPPAHRV